MKLNDYLSEVKYRQQLAYKSDQTQALGWPLYLSAMASLFVNLWLLSLEFAESMTNLLIVLMFLVIWMTLWLLFVQVVRYLERRGIWLG